jgi:sulfur relay (sulfurtransferase) complex TusBCD TusD component (DsrE family)
MTLSRRPTLLTATVSFGIACALALFAWPAAAQDAQKTAVVHIGQYSNDLHSAAMGLSLAGQMQEAGARVTIFADREAVRMGERGQPLLVYGDSDLGTLLTDFLERGGSVLVCAHCAELGGVGADELRDGFEMGTPKSVAALFMDADVVVSY